MHAVFAHLRAIGRFIDNSGIDEAWIQADVFGPVVVKQILTCSHMKRAIMAHEITVTVLYKLYFEALRKEQPSLFAGPCGSVYVLLRDLKQSLKSGSKEKVQATNAAVSSFIGKVGLLPAMKQSEENRKENKMAQVLFIYMRMVERLQSFAYASRNRDWLLHLESRILRFPLVPGPSIDHSSIYTALKYAQHIYTWTDTAIGKTVITLDLDLYFRALQLVQSDDAIQGVLSPRLA